MELVKHTPEEHAAIERDRQLPHAVALLYVSMRADMTFQASAEQHIEFAMVRLKQRADAARMLILSTSISTNLVSLPEGSSFSVMILCQWAEIAKLEEQQRRQFLATGGGDPLRRGI